MKLIKILGLSAILVFSIWLVFLPDTQSNYKIILTVINLGLIFFISDLWDWIVEVRDELKKKKEFKENLKKCQQAGGKYKDYFNNLNYSKHKDEGIISIIEVASKTIYSEKYPGNVDKQNAIRASVYYELSGNTIDPLMKEETLEVAKKLLSQHNYRKLSLKTKDFLNAFAIEQQTVGKQWVIRTKRLISEIIPASELFNTEKKLQQLTRFKEFLRDKFSERFTATNIIETAYSKGKQNCYWIIGKSIDENVKKYLQSLPIFAVLPGKTHNFPGLDSVLFTHYLIRVEDPNISDSNMLIAKLKSISSENSGMLLFVLSIYSKSLKTMEPQILQGSSNYFKQEVSKRIVQYFISGIIDFTISNSDLESAVNSGLISLEEIVQAIPLSFLIKKTSGLKPEFFDQIGNEFKDNYKIFSISDWKDVDIDDLYNSIKERNKSDEIDAFINSLGEIKLRNICKSIKTNARELHNHLHV
jgi:hypothetical protein